MPEGSASTRKAKLLEAGRPYLSRRARIVVDHILEHGHITTEELERDYGYKHAPRAARDVREQGIPLETYYVRSSDDRRIAAYRFADLNEIESGKLGGRDILPKQLKDDLYRISNGKCTVCSGRFEARYLQVDHRVPYEIAGEETAFDRHEKNFMLVCASCNRAKSWSCEHCPNWTTEKSVSMCTKCYWGSPEDYVHIALREIRRSEILWDTEEEIAIYENLKSRAQERRTPIPLYIKQIVAEQVSEGK